MTADRWIRRFSPAPDARSLLVCLPHAGGSASYYLPVARALSPQVDVLAVQYPGRQDRRAEPFVPTVQGMAEEVLAVLRPRLDRPVTLFGHSMGASVAYELAQRMTAEGVPPTGLFVSGRRAPSRHRDEYTHQLDDDGLIAEVKALSGTGSDLLDDDEILRMVLPAIRNDYRAAETYRPEPWPKLKCPVHAFTGADDPKVDEDEVQAWSEHTEGPFEMRVFPGGHFYIDTQAQAVIAAIREHIETSV